MNDDLNDLNFTRVSLFPTLLDKDDETFASI